MRRIGLTLCLLIASAVGQWNVGSHLRPLTASVSCSGHCVKLAWTGSVGATSYNVYRYTGVCSPLPTFGTAYATGLTANPWTDTSVTSGATYCYTMTAVNSLGESADSGVAQAVIP